MTAINAIIFDFELDDVRDTTACRLSEGARRKLSVAIALVMNPRVLLLESISDFLDPWSRQRVCAILHEAMKDRTVLVRHDIIKPYVH